MVDKIQLGDQWYILATESSVNERSRVLKHNDIYAMFDPFGDIQPLGTGEAGIYYNDMRFLSHQELLIDGKRPMFLNSTVKSDNSLLVVELMNGDLHPQGKNPIAKGLLHIFRAKLLWQNACYEHLRVVNHGMEPIDITLSLDFGADYADIFEVRGFTRTKRGEELPVDTSGSEILFGYHGLDDVVRRTRVHFDPPPGKLADKRADFPLSLPPGGESHVYITTTCESDDKTNPRPTDYLDALNQSKHDIESRMQAHSRISSSNALFNNWIDRSASDLVMLTTELPEGLYPYAGVPWYSTTFGRDGILTAREYLWVNPDIAKGVLRFLAATQADEVNREEDAEPGKILHEARNDELARIGAVPFRRYYGSVDATPLFIGLAGAYYERTGDLDFIRTIWPNVLRALEWIDRYGDADGDGFVEYARKTDEGLVNQGWKDSNDSIFHADGSLAQGPIALVEVQGYVYEAKRHAAMLAERLGQHDLSRELYQQARQLKHHFNEVFWCDDIGIYALALDGEKRRCAVRSSNAGHTLWTAIATPERAAKVAQQMVDKEFFCGWGIRTIASDVVRYNPMSYHNGSVWPHDNALIAHGMAQYGMTDKALIVFAGLFETSLFMEQSRMPELFCGFAERAGEGPTQYPVACSPQAWSAAAVFYLLQACLGLSFHPEKREIRFRHPRLPQFLDSVQLNDLTLNGASVDLLLHRHPNNVGINVVRKSGDIDVVVVA